MAINSKKFIIGFITYIIYGIIILAIAGSSKGETTCKLRISGTSNETYYPIGILINTIGIDTWLFVEGSISLIASIITLIWIWAHHISWTRKEYCLYFTMNIIIVIITLFEVSWTVVGAIMIWDSCPRGKSTTNLNLAYFCVLFNCCGGCMKVSKPAHDHLLDKEKEDSYNAI